MRIVEHLREGQLQAELVKAEQRRDPPVPVTMWLSVEGQEWAGDLLGWASNPNGSNDGWRGLVFALREFAPGFWAEFLGWVRAEHIRPRPHQPTATDSPRA